MNYAERPVGKTRDELVRDLRRSVETNPGDMDAQARLNGALERKGIIRRQVPVEESPYLTQDTGDNTTQAAEVPFPPRWVEWNCIYDETGREIPVSIEKILLVDLFDQSIEDLMNEPLYRFDFLRRTLTPEDYSKEILTGERELFILKFEREVTREEVDAWFKQNNLLGATLQELLNIGVQFPQEQDRGSLIALDEAWSSRLCVPALRGGKQGRRLDVHSRDGEYSPTERLVATRKTPSI